MMDLHCLLVLRTSQAPLQWLYLLRMFETLPDDENPGVLSVLPFCLRDSSLCKCLSTVLLPVHVLRPQARETLRLVLFKSARPDLFRSTRPCLRSVIVIDGVEFIYTKRTSICPLMNG